MAEETVLEAEYTPKEILAIFSPDQFVQIGVTIKEDLNLEKGTVLGKITSGGLFAAYDDTETDGTEEAVAILGVDCDTRDGNPRAAMAYVKGVFVESKLVGWDAAAAADLGAKTVPGNGWVMF